MPPLYLFSTAPLSPFQNFTARALRSIAAFTRVHGIETTIVLSLKSTAKRRRWRSGLKQSVWLRAETHFTVRRVGDINAAPFIDSVPDGAHGMIRYFNQIFRPTAVARFETLVNLHGSILPWYRGPRPSLSMSERGETVAGCTLHRVDEGIDSGEILYQRTRPMVGPCTPIRFDYEAAMFGSEFALLWLEHIYLGRPLVRQRLDTPVYANPIGYASAH